MPKMKESPEERLHRKFYGTLRKRAFDLGIDSDAKIAEKIGMSRQTFHNKKISRSWKLGEINHIFAVFHFSNEEITYVFRG